MSPAFPLVGALLCVILFEVLMRRRRMSGKKRALVLWLPLLVAVFFGSRYAMENSQTAVSVPAPVQAVQTQAAAKPASLPAATSEDAIKSILAHLNTPDLHFKYTSQRGKADPLPDYVDGIDQTGYMNDYDKEQVRQLVTAVCNKDFNGLHEAFAGYDKKIFTLKKQIILANHCLAQSGSGYHFEPLQVDDGIRVYLWANNPKADGYILVISPSRKIWAEKEKHNADKSYIGVRAEPDEALNAISAEIVSNVNAKGAGR
ncbi:MAG: hypothetical protein K2W82_10850 [Candidatus Obscuribacterales bacterium]|nr:hypothetical protein [Candidatus Obscuribacterales bacterium]